MSGTLYEGYKDALRRGHLAALRGRLETALAAYREASRMAPDRALPHVGLGDVLARLGRPDEALAAYAAALGRAPGDEAALRGRADIQAETGRRAEAAVTLDRLAAVLEAQGRLADACDVARRALELAESRGRRRGFKVLVARLLEATGDPAAAEALARAMSVLEVDPMVAPGRARATATDPDAGEPAEELAQPEPPPPPPDPGALTLAVEAAIDAGDLDEARRTAVLAVIGHRSLGQLACRDRRLLRGTGHRAGRPGDPPGTGRALPGSGLAHAVGRQAGPPGAPARADRRQRRPSEALCPGGGPICRRAAPGRDLRLSRRPEQSCSRHATRASAVPTGLRAMLHSADDAAAPWIDPRRGQPLVDRRHRHHSAPDLLAVQPDPRNPRRPTRHRRQRPLRGLRPRVARSGCGC